MALHVLIERADFRLASDSALIKRGELRQLEQVLSVFDAAQRSAQQIENQARLAGESAGYRDGYENAVQDAAAALAAAALQRRDTVRALEPLLSQMVMEAVATVLQRVGRERLLFEAVSATRELLRRAQWAVLRVPPAALSEAQRALEQLAQEGPTGTLVRPLADAALADGECRLETDAGEVDAGLHTLLQGLQRAVNSALQGAVMSPSVPPVGPQP